MPIKIVLIFVIHCLIFTSIGCVPAKRKLPRMLNEVSGVAQTLSGATYWINDGGNPAALFKSGARHRKFISFDVSLKNLDWEGLAIYRDSFLCICDIGDNWKAREHLNIAIVTTQGEVVEQRKIRYPSRAFNAEACAIKGDEFFLLTKAGMTKRGAAKESIAYLFKLDLNSKESTLDLIDSLNFSKRSVTDMAWQSDSTLVIVAYDYRVKPPFPKTLTTVYSVEIDQANHFRENTLRERKIHAPFTWTQYESILPLGNDEVLIASERTKLFSARWRIISLPSR